MTVSTKKLRKAASTEKGSERTCIACRSTAARGELIRCVVDQDGGVWVDPYLKAPGRGAHLCYLPKCIEVALKKKAFQRAFKRQLPAISHEELLKQILSAQIQKIDNLLSLGKRRRDIISGLNLLQSSAQLLYLVIFAQDGAEHSLNKLSSKLQCPLFHYGTLQSLGSTQGKEKRVALGITQQALALDIIQEITRYQDFLVAFENH